MTSLPSSCFARMFMLLVISRWGYTCSIMSCQPDASCRDDTYFTTHCFVNVPLSVHHRYRKRCDNQSEPYFHKLKCSKAPYTPPSRVVDDICNDDMCDDEFSAMFRTFVFLQLFILVLAVGIWYKWPGSIKFSSESTTMAKLAWFSFYGPAQHGFPVHITLAGDAELMHEVAEKLYAYMPDTLLQKPVTDMLQVTGSVSAAPVT
eukprot:m.193224 g.193224  ORF g.193224 m.193224 type:complete len:204 (+) comp18626_c0_seq2:1293-1904(+)